MKNSHALPSDAIPPTAPARGGGRELFTSLALALLIALMVGYGLLALRMEKSRQDLAQSRLALYLDEIAHQLESGLRFGVPLADIGAGPRTAATLLEQDADVRLVLVVDDKGQPVMVQGEEGLLGQALAPLPAGTGAPRGELWVVHRALRDVIATQAGEVRLVYSSRALRAELDAQLASLRVWIAGLGLAGLLALALLARWIVGGVERGLGELDQALDQPLEGLRDDPRLSALGRAIVELERIEQAGVAPAGERP